MEQTPRRKSPRTGLPAHVTPEEVDRLVIMRMQGYSTREMSRLTGMGGTTVLRHVRKRARQVIGPWRRG